MAILENRVGDEGQEILDHVKPLPANPPFVIACHLFDFAIGSSFLKPDHQKWLTEVGGRFLNNNEQATFQAVAMTSRSGAAAFNQRLSERRLQMVLDFLAKPPRSVSLNKLVSSAAVGELLAARANERDGSEDRLMRAVTILMFNLDPRLLVSGTAQTMVAPLLR
jgi:outer membrane protein OmpA-like peptidoglycan-associated protein